MPLFLKNDDYLIEEKKFSPARRSSQKGQPSPLGGGRDGKEGGERDSKPEGSRASRLEEGEGRRRDRAAPGTRGPDRGGAPRPQHRVHRHRPLVQQPRLAAAGIDRPGQGETNHPPAPPIS